MSLYNYVDAPNNNLLCCICRAPFTEPVTTITCQHTFCRECITRALSHAPQCPVDRSPLSEEELGPVNPIVRSLVDELVVECVYKEEGCQERVQRQLLAAHLKDECKFSEAGIVRGELEKGKSKEVGKVDEKQLDERGGSQTATESEKEASSLKAKEEPNASTSTKQASSNTPTGTRRVSRLTEQNVLLRHRVETLEGAVQFLRKEIAMVRTVLSPWMQNCASAGQPSTSYTSNRGPPTRTESIAPPIQQSLSQPSRSSSGTRNGFAEGSSSTRSPESSDGEYIGSQSEVLDRNDLASYFPAEDEVRVRRTATSAPTTTTQPPIPEFSQTRQRPPGVGHLHHHSLSSIPGLNPGDVHTPPGASAGLGMGYYGHPTTTPYGSMGLYASMLSPSSGPGPQYQPQPLGVAVPELDTSTPSLAATLHGLHSGVVALAASIEDIHKKSDLALALMGGTGTGAAMPGGGVVGEVLRLGEEVMGVRATVQGLRMQMHGLMMGSVGAGGPGMFSPTGRPPQAMNPNNHGPDDGAAEGYGLASPMQQGLQNQRMFYPVAAGITKL